MTTRLRLKIWATAYWPNALACALIVVMLVLFGVALWRSNNEPSTPIVSRE